MPQEDYTPAFVEENELKVTPPDLSDIEVRKALKKHPMWKEFDSRCISCGSCTVACSTCTCFTTRDVIYGDNPEVGERRRVSASCQIEGFDQMAGQRELRSTPGDRMRFKVYINFMIIRPVLKKAICVLAAAAARTAVRSLFPSPQR